MAPVDHSDKFISHDGDIKIIHRAKHPKPAVTDDKWQADWIRRRDDFFSGEIRKFHLVSSSICLIPDQWPKKGEEVEQRLTVNRKGQVWLTHYASRGEILLDAHVLTGKEQFSVPKAAAGQIFAALREVFTGDYRQDWWLDDQVPWELTLTNERDETWFTTGSPYMHLLTHEGPLSAVIRRFLGRQDLFLFENRPGPAPGELIFCDVSFSQRGKTYCYLADEDLYEEGDHVLVPTGDAQEAKQARVENVRYLKPEDAPWPVDQLKHILRKVQVKHEQRT